MAVGVTDAFCMRRIYGGTASNVRFLFCLVSGHSLHKTVTFYISDVPISNAQRYERDLDRYQPTDTAVSG